MLVSTAYFHHNFASIGDKTHCYDVSLPHFTFLLPILTMFLKRESRLKLNIFYASCLESKRMRGKKKSVWKLLFLLQIFYTIFYSILKFNYREKLFFEKFFRDNSFPRKLDPLFWIFSRTENEMLENWESLKFLFRFLKISSSSRQNFPLQSFKNSKKKRKYEKKFWFPVIKFYIRAQNPKRLKIFRCPNFSEIHLSSFALKLENEMFDRLFSKHLVHWKEKKKYTRSIASPRYR